LGNGDGTFQPPTDYYIDSGVPPTSWPPTYGWVTTADFNRDGNIDFAAEAGSGLQVFIGNGDGSFSGVRQSDAFGFYLFTADFNGDSYPDLAFNGAAGDHILAISIKLGRGDGTFDPVYDVAQRPYGGAWEAPATAADLNLDGVVDLAIQLDLDGIFLVAGPFTPYGGDNYEYAAASVQGQPAGITTADFNGDGNPDVVAAARDIYARTGDIVVLTQGCIVVLSQGCL
jgi:hypothetical protein